MTTVETRGARPGSEGALLERLLEFGRILRAAGMRVTTEQIIDVAKALGWVGIEDRMRVYRVCRALLVKRKEDLALFDTFFGWFWRAHDPPTARGRAMPPAPRFPTRQERPFTIATFAAFKAKEATRELDVIDRAGSYADAEQLRNKRFADMNDEEIASVRRLLGRMQWEVAMRRTRRHRSHRHGRSLDLRQTLRRTARLGAVPPRLPRRRRAVKPRPIVVLADISGSMERYSRLLLQFLHAMSMSYPRVETFVFATRLSRITPYMRLRNPDRALDQAAGHVRDWAGGTRIGRCLGDFNREWSRRVLGRGAVVVIISDGCDRESADVVSDEMRFLQRRCNRLIWLNPYLGHERYEPRVAGMEAALPFVDDFLPVHNVQALEDFSEALARPSRRGPTPDPRTQRSTRQIP